MKNNNLIRFAQSLVLLPAMTMSFSNPGMHSIETSQNVLVQKFNTATYGSLVFNPALDPEVEILKTKAEAIDAYFKERDMPLEGMGMKMVEEAEKNNLDWRLLPAIAIRESTGGKFECRKADYNFFGWGSCKIHFESNEHAIEIVARNLGGNNPNTARHYDNKTTLQILRAYNPPSIVPRYAQQVISIMSAIGEPDVTATISNGNYIALN